jgi:molybdate transport system ATP-binding protein
MSPQIKPSLPDGPILGRPSLPFSINALHLSVRKRHSSSSASEFQLDVQFMLFPGVTVIVGHSGAGKTTILRSIAGLCHPDEGRIAIGDRMLFDSAKGINVEPAKRRVAFVFQDLALFPHMTVHENVTYGLRRMETAERESRAAEIMTSFQIAHLSRRFPREISGGERQRVALARSLVTEPSILLLDEPLSSLDPLTKARIIEDLRKWNETHRIPILYVTHDYEEVIAMGDRAIAMEQGRVVTEGAPADIIDCSWRDALDLSSSFENIFDATVVERREEQGVMVCRIAGTAIHLEVPIASVPLGSEISLGIRAYEILVASSTPALVGSCNVLRGRVSGTLGAAGPYVEARVSCGAEFRVRINSHSAANAGLFESAEVWLMIRPEACRLVRARAATTLRRLFVFVCSTNTSRSPMAQAICNAEIARRFGVPIESLERLGIKALSAGLTAEPGQPLTGHAKQALEAIGTPSHQHRSCNMTHQLAKRAEAIFCMAEEQRRQLIAMFPEAAQKTYCLNPDVDLQNPHGHGIDVFIESARQIEALIRQRLDTLGVVSTTELGWA